MRKRKPVSPSKTMPPEPRPAQSPGTPHPDAPRPGTPDPSDQPRWPRDPNPNREYGEGNYAASKQYNDAAKRYAETRDVEQAARDAAPESLDEAGDLARAEEAGRRRAKDEDPILTRRTR